MHNTLKWNSRLKKQAAFSLLVAVFSVCQCSFGSLVIMLYHNEAMYFGSDSLGTFYSNGQPAFLTHKIFRFSDNCCASITGFACYNLTNTDDNTVISLSLPKALEDACAEEVTNPVSIQRKIELIAARLNQDYFSFSNRATALAGTPDNHEPTRLQFVGYDAERGSFFVRSCVLGEASSPQIELIREFKNPTDPTPISLQGELHFLQALLGGEKPELVNLISPEFSDTAAQLITTNDVSDEKIKAFILEMFQLHKDNAAKLGYDRGWIAPPYQIFKITKADVARLTPDVYPPPPKTSPPIVQSDNADGQAIDAVMAKLESSFMANDYSYAVQVMYAPVLEAMGGKEKALEAANNAVAQMQQQQMSMISWKAQKPYRYIEGQSRKYAIIPYESIMTVGGQKLQQNSYQLGIKDAGSQWQFVNGDNLTPEIFKEFFPDFPADVELPKVRRSYE